MDFGRGKLDFRRGKSRYFPRDSLVSGDFGDLFSYPICYHVCTQVYFVEFKYSQLKINHLNDTPSTKAVGGGISNSQGRQGTSQGHEAELDGTSSSNSLVFQQVVTLKR